jgi:hypothetical protein
MKTREEEQRRKRELTDTDIRLKVEQKLARIHATSGEKFPDEIDAFEQQMRRNQVKSWKLWYYYFETSLEPRAKEWVDGTHTREPGQSRYEFAQRPDAPDHAWAEVYPLARSELARRVGLAHETPGDNTQAQWDAIAFPKDAGYKDIDRVLTDQ